MRVWAAQRSIGRETAEDFVAQQPGDLRDSPGADCGFGDHHFSVVKRDKKGRTTTEIDELDGDDRAREIGRMLSGEKITTEALKQAEQLIQAGANA